MSRIRIGIICPSEIAFRRFLPAILECEEFEYVGVAVPNCDEWQGITPEQLKAEQNKAEEFKKTAGGKVFNSYTEMLTSTEIDAVYLPLPPALHYKWAKIGIENNKHLFLEKPSTTTLADTESLLQLAKDKKIAIHENYMFNFHSQIDWIESKINDGVIGDVRLIRIAFGFPKRESNDFRYSKALGGGALLDCGGYTLKLASRLLGETAKITTSKLNYTDELDVDIFGSATMDNDMGLTAQLSFGMDNSYKCDLEVWGSKGSIFANRILTAPVGFEPKIELKLGNENQIITLDSDDTFKKSIMKFYDCITNSDERLTNYSNILKQSQLVDKVMVG